MTIRPIGPAGAAWIIAFGLWVVLVAYSQTHRPQNPEVIEPAALPAASLTSSRESRWREQWRDAGVLPVPTVETPAKARPLTDWSDDPDAAWGWGP